MVFAKPTDPKNAEPEHMPLFIDPLHDCIVSSWTHETRRLTEPHFQVIRFRVKPNFYFFGHNISPGFS